MEPWAVALIVVAVFALVAIAAWDTTRAMFSGGKAFRSARDRRAENDAKAERLHRLVHPEERDGDG